MIFEKADWIETEREELRRWAEENEEVPANLPAADLRGTEPLVATASSASVPLKSNQSLVKSKGKADKTSKCLVS